MNEIKTNIIYFGKDKTIVCNGNCDDAWGINWRSKKDGKAPEDPGTYEGGHAKPTEKAHNKWCARECEMSGLVDGHCGENVCPPAISDQIALRESLEEIAKLEKVIAVKDRKIEKLETCLEFYED